MHMCCASATVGGFVAHLAGDALSDHQFGASCETLGSRRTRARVTRSVWVMSGDLRPKRSAACHRAFARCRWIVPAILSVSMAACAVGPDFGPPSAPLADTFIGAHNRAVATEGRNASRDYRDWWTAFHDP